jgi:uroporphyrinogen decarboxylase
MALAIRHTAQHVSQDVLLSLEGMVTPKVPFWLMRQAGRYLPEYRALREKAGGFLDLCYNPELAAEATLQPVRRFDTDAAILFSDILVLPQAMGQEVSFAPGEGPRLGALDIAQLELNLEKLKPVYDAARLVRAALVPQKTLIGFSGAPWTLACYMIEGEGNGSFEKTRLFAIRNEAAFARLIDKLTEAVTAHLVEQVKAGAGAVQLFDSWAGLLPKTLFMKWVMEPAKKIVAELRKQVPGTPVIGFPRGAGALYPLYAAETGCSGIGIDSQTPLAWARREMGADVCLQGNLDPAILCAGGTALEMEVARILDIARGQPFIFNLGHGVWKDTPPEHVERLALLLRGFRR